MISIETRFFGTSRPSPADWTKLTIAQAAADEHHIVDTLKTIYTANWLATGPSKGGMTTVFYRRFYPDDVAGSLPYVAPLSFGTDDTRYSTFLDSVGTDACRQAVRTAATDMLQNRRAALLQMATADAAANGYQYTRIAIGPALESAIESLEWSFWQYNGITVCPHVTTAASTDQQAYNFLEQISPVESSDDDGTAEFEAYDYQAAFQLGEPDGGGAYLTPYEIYTADDYAGAFPVGVDVPTFDATAMMDIDNWVQTNGSRLMFIYGQWDPWSAGEYVLGNATQSSLYVHAQGTHGSEFGDLVTADREAAYQTIETWAGTLSSGRILPTSRAQLVRHVPAATRAALRLRHAR
jgi:hypothetical protein